MSHCGGVLESTFSDAILMTIPGAWTRHNALLNHVCDCFTWFVVYFVNLLIDVAKKRKKKKREKKAGV